MKREIKIGLTLMSAVVIIYLCFAWMKSLQFFDEGHKNYKIAFDNVNGLLKGASVNVFGYPAGEVTEIQPTQENVIVYFRLSDKIALYTDAHAEIQLKELMGGKQIEIHLGKSKEILPENGTITGVASLDLTSSFSVFGQVVKSIDTTKIQGMLANMERITKTSAEIAEMIDVRKMNTMIQELQVTSLALRKASISTDEVIGEIKGTNPQNTLNQSKALLAEIDKTMKNINSLLLSANEMLQDGKQIMANTEQLTQKAESHLFPQSDTLMRQMFFTLQETRLALQDIQQITQKFDQNFGTLEKILSDSSYIQKIDSTLNGINQTMEFVRKNKMKVGLNWREKP